MRKVAVFFRLIRWPNLLFIAITQLLFYYFIFPFANERREIADGLLKLQPGTFYLILASSLFIAAAGYIINDYFDVNIDQINKPDKVIVGKYVYRRTAILLHAFFSIIGLLLVIYAGYRLKNIYLPFFNLVAILLLLLYSSTFKRKLLIGNVLISALTAWVIFVLVVAEYRFTLRYDAAWQVILKYAILYGGFAFILSLIREVIKDMEDVDGDARYNCTTMPVVWGIPASKVYTGVWIIVLTCMITALIIYILFYGWWAAFVYGLAAIVLPLLYVLKKLFGAFTPQDFHKLSTVIKLIMLAGILSMIFFWIA